MDQLAMLTPHEQLVVIVLHLLSELKGMFNLSPGSHCGPLEIPSGPRWEFKRNQCDDAVLNSDASKTRRREIRVTTAILRPSCFRRRLHFVSEAAIFPKRYTLVLKTNCENFKPSC